MEYHDQTCLGDIGVFRAVVARVYDDLVLGTCGCGSESTIDGCERIEAHDSPLIAGHNRVRVGDHRTDREISVIGPVVVDVDVADNIVFDFTVDRFTKSV